MKHIITLAVIIFIFGCKNKTKDAPARIPPKERHLDYFNRMHVVYRDKTDAFISAHMFDSSTFYLGKMLGMSEACDYEFDKLYPKK